MPKETRKFYQELNRHREDGDTSGFEKHLQAEESVKRFQEHTKLCKDNLKNWRLDV